jgi:glycosyltransferase involved in cell wall biosynthesis/O-antigen ligase
VDGLVILAVAAIGLTLVLAGLLDRRVLVAVLTASIVTNASGVLEVEHGVQGFVLPLALLVIGAGVWDRMSSASAAAPREETPLAWLGLLLVAAAALSATIGPFVSDHPVDSALQVDLLTRDLLIVVAVAAVVVDPSTLRAALIGLVVGGVMMASVTDVQALLGWQDQSFGGFGRWSVEEIAGSGLTPRAAGPFGDDANSYAQHLVVALGASIGLARAHGRSWAATPFWFAAALITAGVLATRSRGGLLALAGIGAVALILSRSVRGALVATGSVATVVLLGPFGVSERISTLTQVGAVGGDVDSSLNGRASEALVALRLFAEHPLTGVGFGAYPSEYLGVARSIGLESRATARSAHSLPLEIAAEQGLVGLAAWTALLVFCAWVAHRVRHRLPDIGGAYLFALTGFLLTALFLHDVYPRLMWTLVAVAVAAARFVDREPARPASAAAPVGPVVAMVIQNYVPALGGAECQLANLMPRLRARGVHPVVITRALAGRPTRDEVDGVPVVRVPVRGPGSLQSLLFVHGARRELRTLRPDVIHAFDTLTPSLIALGHRRAHGTPVVTKLLRSGEIGDLAVLARKPLGERRRRALVEGVDRFVAISSDLVDELRRLGVPDDHILHIPNGVDIERFRPRHRQANGDRRSPRVIATGRLVPEKRLHELAAHWERVRECHPTAELVLVGDGPERPKVDGYPGTRLLGRRDDVPDRLREADVYVSASSGEGLSNSLLEAMATGLPCVVTDVGGVRDVIVDGVHGFIVDPQDMEALVERVNLLLGAPDRRRSIGRAARRRMTTGWSLDATATALADCYHELATGATSSPDSADEAWEHHVGSDSRFAGAR